ncbi:MAG: hypothetical protein KKD18_01685 [Nanoarchaeota archaeon]|nr:hypothetical protein [Nanoarchaeota archaeon]MBU0977105.1 hypothetical protein [Nanoarchaeota archaeon]
MSETRVLEELERRGWIWLRTCPINDGSEGREHLLSFEELLKYYQAVYGERKIRMKQAFDREGNSLPVEKWVDVYVK